MNDNTIRYADMIDQMDALDPNGNPVMFSIVFVTADRKNSSGGQIHIIGDSLFCKSQKQRIVDSVLTDSKSIKVVGRRKNQTIIDRRPKDQVKAEVNPNHRKNNTRNIMILSSKAIRKVHLRLILYFNDKKVIP